MLFLGDSLTVGARDGNQLSWPYYLAQISMNHDYVIFPEIEAVSGQISGELVKRSLPVIQNTDAKEAFVLIGTNDAKTTHNISPDQYIDNINLIGACCRQGRYGITCFPVTILAHLINRG